MKIVSAVELRGPPKILIYSAPGVGKTTLGAQGPRPMLLLDFDMGATYVLESPLITAEGLDIAREIDLDKTFELGERLAAGEESKYKAIFFDSLSELQVQHRRSHLSTRLIATKKDYGHNTVWVRRLVKNLQEQTQLTIIYSAHQDWTEDIDGLRLHAALTPALLRSVEGYVDVMVYLAARSKEDKGVSLVERVAITSGTERIRAKDRTGRLEAKVLNPTWESLFGPLYEGGETNE